MALTRVSPALFQVSNNITSVTVGGSANTISLTFDSNGVITGASNNALLISNTAITGNIISSQITSVANTQLTGTITGSQISSNTLSNTVFQTGSVEAYMRAVNLDFGLRNRIINGQMTIDQRNAGASYSAVDSTYGLDRWKLASWDGSSQVTGKYTVIQSSTAPAGFPTSMLITSSAATTIAAGAIYWVGQMIEGFNTADLDFGKATAKSVTVSFWVRSSLTGDFSGAIANSAHDRSYPFSYTINSANTFEFKTVTIPGDTSGTWLTTNGIGIRIFFNLGSGTTYRGTAGAWSGSQLTSVTGTTSLLATNAATLYIAGVQLEEGSQATPFEYRHHSKELSLCQRYYEVFLLGATGAPQNLFLSGVLTGGNCTHTCYFKTTKRTDPSWAAVGGATWQNTPNNSTTSKDCAIFQNTSSGYFYLGNGVNHGAGFSAEL